MNINTNRLALRTFKQKFKTGWTALNVDLSQRNLEENSQRRSFLAIPIITRAIYISASSNLTVHTEDLLVRHNTKKNKTRFNYFLCKHNCTPHMED